MVGGGDADEVGGLGMLVVEGVGMLVEEGMGLLEEGAAVEVGVGTGGFKMSPDGTGLEAN